MKITVEFEVEVQTEFEVELVQKAVELSVDRVMEVFDNVPLRDPYAWITVEGK